MDERVAKLETSKDARQLAENAQQRGHAEVAAQALARARELQAVEEGHQSPAQIAIASALYAYEEEQSKLLKRKFRASRTRQMFDRRGALESAERMVMQPRQSTGFEVLDGAGLRALSFEAIIDQHPQEFSDDAIAAARARLRGEPPPPRPKRRPPPAMAHVAPTAARPTATRPAVFDAEALSFLTGFRSPDNRFMHNWLPEYRTSIATIADALAAGREEDLFDLFWKRADNDIANAGQGLLKYADVDNMRTELVQVIRDIHHDGSPDNVERIVTRFESWKAQGHLAFVPRLLIARVFAGIHPDRYHTTVDDSSQRSTLQWFAEHTGFTRPPTTSWSVIAEALTAHLSLGGMFGNDILERNVFPWFVVEQLSARTQPGAIPPGHKPRVHTTQLHAPEAMRTVSLRHNALQTALYQQLVDQYSPKCVWTEFPTGTGGFADAVARLPDEAWHLFEIKVAATAADVVRQAMGQLLEYGFRKGGLQPAKLFAVGETALDELTRQFLALLHTQFNLDIDYVQITLADGWAGEPGSAPPLDTTAPVSE